MTVGIIGAGLSGLLVAGELDRRGIETIVLEASDRIGGMTSTIYDGGFLFEPGGGSFLLPHPALDHFVEHFSLEVTPARAARRRYLGTTGGLIELPANPMDAITSPVLSAKGKLRALAEVGVTSASPDGESILGFMQRRFGPEAGRLAAHLASSGVFAGDPSQLAVAACFPALTTMERSAGSILRGAVEARRNRPPDAPKTRLHVPAAGMTDLLDQIADPLGDRVRTGFAVESVEPSGAGWSIAGPDRIEVAQVVAAIEPTSFSRIAPTDIAPVFVGRPSAPVAVVGLGAPAASLPLPPGFGALTHPDAGHVGMGVLFESSYAPARAPEGMSLVKVIAGGALHPEVMEWSDDYLTRVVGQELATILGSHIEAEWVHVARHRRGIPQYNVGHLRWLDRVETVLGGAPGLHVTGWGYRGVGIAHVATDALRLSKEIAAT